MFPGAVKLSEEITFQGCFKSRSSTCFRSAKCDLLHVGVDFSVRVDKRDYITPGLL